MMMNDMKKNELNEQEMDQVTGGADSQENYYTVKAGDCLSTIADRYQTSVVKLLLLNPQIKNPHLIHPGDVIRLYL